MDIGSTAKSITNLISEGPFSNLFKNPIYVALLITTIVILIVVCIYNERTIVKTSFYIMCSCMFIVFIHNKLMLIEHRRQLCSADEQNICRSIDEGPKFGGNNTDVAGLGYLKNI